MRPADHPHSTDRTPPPHAGSRGGPPPNHGVPPSAGANLTAALAAWLDAGGHAIGQVRISRRQRGWEVRHEADSSADPGHLTLHSDPGSARELALYDEAGNYRPLKAAPTLRRGWRMEARDLQALRETLDFFYPAALGSWVAFARGGVQPVPLRETLERQTGMYRITARLTDAQAREVVRTTCEFATGCRRRIAWELDKGVPLGCLTPDKTELTPGKGEMPILCLEACNWLVAQARSFLRQTKDPAAGAQP